jgi:tetratricopeptide (TPR) repeat protein
MMVNEPSLSSFGETAAKDGKPVNFEKVSVAEILALRKNYASNADAAARQEARARLAALATLSEDKARTVANSSDASIPAKVGAAKSLPASEAERVLLSAIQASPDDPYLRDELAKLYASQPNKQAEATAQLLEESRLDPENALNEYKLASNLMRQGDTAGATEALERAKSLQTVDSYSTSSDASTTESLEASGVSSDVARALTALNSGISQYSDLIELASNLLTDGSQAENEGDATYAKAVYESVRVLGSQISDSTSLSNERMAGLDIQSSALDSLLALAAASGSTDETQTLTSQINSLATAYQEIVKILDGINTFFSGNVSENTLQLISDFVLQYGDLNLLDYLANLSNQ